MYQRSSTYVMTCKNGWERMMNPVYWEGGPPVDLADRLVASYPHLMNIELKRREARAIAEDDKCVLSTPLLIRGFRVCVVTLLISIFSFGKGVAGRTASMRIQAQYGHDGHGIRALCVGSRWGVLSRCVRNLDHDQLFRCLIHPDVGASQMIIDGKIKLKNDSQIAEFTEGGLKFENGSELPADVIVFATGYAAQLKS